ncbi:hypothetical protein RvY_16604 [Ramazzottius varieornatus]|uniref:Peptidase M12A domain-containing protein n=1 Tax=Ramazzottius varieornatus TaxID=947166 RepID=A0A1D1W3B9_RAMVA|nr:hypothetical protein RvY_16604 [Ramazzottius varieornatus]
MTRTLAATAVLFAAFAVSNGAVWNNDARYTNWNVAPGLKDRNGLTKIPVFLEDVAYRADPTCLASINKAITAMNADLQGCIMFDLMTTPTPSSLGKDFVWISTKFNNGTESDTCLSVPGRIAAQNKQGQRLYIKGSTAAKGGHCCATERPVMRFLAHTIGMRNEFNRADRDSYLKVTPENVDPAVAQYGMYTKLAPGQGQNLGRFDHTSITMAENTENGAGKTTFTPISTTAKVGNKPKLSLEDCFHIKNQYGCTTMTLPCDTDAYP